MCFTYGFPILVAPIPELMDRKKCDIMEWKSINEGRNIYVKQERYAASSLLRRYSSLRLQELTPTILNDMVQRIYVHAPEKINGKRTQQIDIYYDLVGFLPMSLFQNENQAKVA